MGLLFRLINALSPIIPQSDGGAVNIFRGKSTFTNCTFTANQASGSGGGVYDIYSNDLMFTNCTFDGNSALEHGGAFYGMEDTYTMNGCSITRNTSIIGGGGLYNLGSTGLISIKDGYFGANAVVGDGEHSLFGGGISNRGSEVEIIDTTFYANVLAADSKITVGGGVYNEASTVMLISCLFDENSASFAGGLLNQGGDVVVDQCLFTKNIASKRGGGVINGPDLYTGEGEIVITNSVFMNNVSLEEAGAILNVDYEPIITNCTLKGNSAGRRGGGIYNQDAHLVLTNSILWGNNAPDGSHIYERFSTSSVTYSNIQGGYTGEGNIDQDPLLTDYWAYKIPSGSPCIDTGTNSAPELSSPDVIGNKRIVDGDGDGVSTVDMGAYENIPVVWYVDQLLGLDSIDCSRGDQWNTAFRTISKAVGCAGEGNWIWVKEGNYELSSQLSISKKVSLFGGFNGQEMTLRERDLETSRTVLDGNDLVPCLQITDDCLIDGFTITRGNGGNGVAGGVYVNAASPTFSACNFTYNAAFSGGAAYVLSGAPQFLNCVFLGNTASNLGGAILNSNGTTEILNCSFSGNVANVGGAIYNSNASPVIKNSIFWGDSPSEVVNSGTSAPQVSYCDIQGGYAGGSHILDKDPLFLDSIDLHLSQHSPCVDAGTSIGAPAFDMDSDTRPQRFRIDIGADEVFFLTKFPWVMFIPAMIRGE